jgi:hypothetical protein
MAFEQALVPLHWVCSSSQAAPFAGFAIGLFEIHGHYPSIAQSQRQHRQRLVQRQQLLQGSVLPFRAYFPPFVAL